MSAATKSKVKPPTQPPIPAVPKGWYDATKPLTITLPSGSVVILPPVRR